MRAANLRAVAVFEHQRLRLHDLLLTRAGSSIPLDEALFNHLLRVNDQQPTRFLEAGHRSLRFLSRVGVVQCGGVTFEILPKADRASDDENQGRWHRALVEMLCIARQVPVQRGQRGMLELRQRDLLSVFLLLFLDEVEQLQREGLARSYHDHEANLPQFRGRLLVKEQLRQNLVHRERFYTSHALFDADNPANVMLRDALVAVSRCASDGDLADRSRRLLASFPELGKSRRRPAAAAAHSRSLARYQDALTLARWILDHFTPAVTSGAEHAFVYLVEMNLLFQEVVAAMFKQLISSGLQVASQARRPFWPEEETVRRGLRPDLIIRGPGGAFVVDTKWKTHGRSAPSDEDLRQVYVYCKYFSAQRGVLLYPKTDDAPLERVGTFVRRESARPEMSDGPVRCELRYLTLFNSKGEFDRAEIGRQLRELSGLARGRPEATPEAT